MVKHSIPEIVNARTARHRQGIHPSRAQDAQEAVTDGALCPVGKRVRRAPVRSVKYEHVYLKAYDSVSAVRVYIAD